MFSSDHNRSSWILIYILRIPLKNTAIQWLSVMFIILLKLFSLHANTLYVVTSIIKRHSDSPTIWVHICYDLLRYDQDTYSFQYSTSWFSNLFQCLFGFEIVQKLRSSNCHHSTWSIWIITRATAVLSSYVVCVICSPVLKFVNWSSTDTLTTVLYFPLIYE